MEDGNTFPWIDGNYWMNYASTTQRIILHLCIFYRQIFNIRRNKSQNSSRLAAVFVQFIEARCWVENEDVGGVAPIGDDPTTSEWSTIALPTKVGVILDAWCYVFFYVYFRFDIRLSFFTTARYIPGKSYHCHTIRCARGHHKINMPSYRLGIPIKMNYTQAHKYALTLFTFSTYIHIKIVRVVILVHTQT